MKGLNRVWYNKIHECISTFIYNCKAEIIITNVYNFVKLQTIVTWQSNGINSCVSAWYACPQSEWASDCCLTPIHRENN